jgi:hypothetical protein
MGHCNAPDGRGIGRSLSAVEVAAPAAVGLGPELPLKLHQAPDAGAVGAHVRLNLGGQLADGGQVDAEQLRVLLQRRRDRPARVRVVPGPHRNRVANRRSRIELGWTAAAATMKDQVSADRPACHLRAMPGGVWRRLMVLHGHSDHFDLRPFLYRSGTARMVRMGRRSSLAMPGDRSGPGCQGLQLQWQRPPRPGPERCQAALGHGDCRTEPRSTTTRTASGEVAGSRAPSN